MASQTPFPVVQREHDAHRLAAIRRLRDNFFSGARVGRLGKALHDRDFEFIGLILWIPEQIIRGRLFEIHAGLRHEFRGGLCAEGGRDEALEPDALFIDHGLIVGHGLLLGFHELRQEFLRQFGNLLAL